MRLWSLHPKYLDKSGLIACWREGLLAYSVLKKIKANVPRIGYRNHSQLVRFKAQKDPISFVSDYLHCVVDEAEERGYNYKREKLQQRDGTLSLTVTTGQIVFEYSHLASKLISRAPQDYKRLQLASYPYPESHPMFTMVEGEIESWEKV